MSALESVQFFFFFGASSPLSNWHAKSFEVKGIRFAHVEQKQLGVIRG